MPARDALIVWTETKILIDGHNRYAICTRLGLPFSIEWMSFESESDALAYVDLQQFARRNQETNWIDYQRGARYRVERKDAHARPGNDNAKREDHNSANVDPPVSTSETIAKSTGVSQATVKRDAKFADAWLKIEPPFPSRNA
jgi:hypothetical protein